MIVFINKSRFDWLIILSDFSLSLMGCVKEVEMEPIELESYSDFL